MIQDFRSFFTSFVLNDESGELTLISDESSKTIKLFEEVNMNTNVFNNPEIIKDSVSNHMKYSPTDGSFLIPDDESEVLYRENGRWNKIYNKDNEDGYFRIPYYMNDKVYQQDEIVSYKKSFYKTIENNAFGVSPTTLTLNNNINNGVLTPILTAVSSPRTVSYEDNKIYIGTSSEFYSLNMVLEDPTIETGDGGDFQYITFFGNQLTVNGQNIYIENEDFTYTMNTAVRMAFVNNDYLYVIRDSFNYIYVYEYANNSPVNMIPFQEPTNSSFFISGSKYNDEIALTSNGSDEIVLINEITYTKEVTTTSGVSDIISSTIVEKEIFMIRSDNMLYRIQLVDSKWEKITVDELFQNNSCDNFYEDEMTFLNVILSSKNNYVDFRPSAFTVYENKYVFVSIGDYTGKIIRLDSSSGAINATYHGDMINIDNGSITGLTVFQGKLYISQGKEIKYVTEVDIETMTKNREIDLSGIISGTNIQDLSSLGDTIYVLSNNGVMYGFSDIGGQPTSTVSLEEFTFYSKIAIVKNNLAYLTNHREDIQTIALFDTINGALVESSMGIDVDSSVLINFSGNSLFTIDVNNLSTFSQYKRAFTRKLIT